MSLLKNKKWKIFSCALPRKLFIICFYFPYWWDDATDDDLELSVNWENKTGRPLMSNHPEDTQTLTAKFNIESPKENALEFSFGGTQKHMQQKHSFKPSVCSGRLFIPLSLLHPPCVYIYTYLCHVTSFRCIETPTRDDE